MDDSLGIAIIPEVGINHGGNLACALRMVKEAKRSNFKCLKFQVFNAERFILDNALQYQSQSMKEMFRKYQLTYDDFKEIKKACDDEGIVFFATPQDIEDIDFLIDSLDVHIIKIGSDDLATTPLLEHLVAKQPKAGVFLSCGMATIDEIQDAVTLLDPCFPLTLLHCVSLYPPQPSEMNLQKIATLGKLYPNVDIGFSNHTTIMVYDLIALGLGARVFERHIRLEEGPITEDTAISLTFEEMIAFRNILISAFESLGSGALVPTQRELTEMRPIARRSLVVLKDVGAGDVITVDNLGYKRPGTGIPVKYYNDIIGRTFSRAIEANTLLRWSHVEEV